MKLSKDLKLRQQLGEQVALSERQILLLEILQNQGQITSGDATAVLPNVSIDTILRDLKDLIEKGMNLKENQVYSYKRMPILNGDYSLENFEMTDISVHFSMTGQICRQVKDLPEGTRINKVVITPFANDRCVKRFKLLY